MMAKTEAIKNNDHFWATTNKYARNLSTDKTETTFGKAQTNERSLCVSWKGFKVKKGTQELTNVYIYI